MLDNFFHKNSPIKQYVNKFLKGDNYEQYNKDYPATSHTS
jgi:hypothetical protein